MQTNYFHKITFMFSSDIHIPDHTVCAQTPHPDLRLSSQDFPHLWQLHPETNHNLTGPAWVSAFDCFIAKEKGHQKLELSISFSLSISAHGIWQPKRAMYQKSTCFAKEPGQSTPEVLCPAYIIFLDITHPAMYWRILPPLRTFHIIKSHQDLEIQRTGQNTRQWMQHSWVHMRR